MSVGPRIGRMLGLAAFAASLFACGHGDIRSERVSAAALDSARSDVASSTLEQSDKDAFAHFVDAHARDPKTFDGKTVNEIITMQRSYEHGQQLAANEAHEEQLHRAMLARLIRVQVTGANEGDGIDLHTAIANLTGKTVKRIEMGLYVHHGSTRVGMCEVALDTHIAPHATVSRTIALHYTQFGEDATSMMHARGQTKTYDVQVKEIKYTDGTDAGFDD